MSKRIPLTATLIPLIVGLLVYYYWWDGRRARFSADLARVLGAPVVIGGFPYRLEADLGPSALSRVTPLITVRLSAAGLDINRAPVGRPLTVVSALKPVVSAGINGIGATTLTVRAANSRSSLRLTPDGRIARLSNAFEDAVVHSAALALPATARRFEVHIRETPQALDPASKSPAYPEQAQLVVRGEGVRYGGGDPVTLTVEFGLNAKAPLARDRAVLDGATFELKKLEIADKTGVIATLSATLSPDQRGRILANGTIQTVCPATVLALLDGKTAPRELRRRHEDDLQWSGRLGAITATGGVTDAPVRSQEPPCPALRR